LQKIIFTTERCQINYTNQIALRISKRNKNFLVALINSSKKEKLFCTKVLIDNKIGWAPVDFFEEI
jgi:hypothetical protein